MSALGFRHGNWFLDTGSSPGIDLMTNPKAWGQVFGVYDAWGLTIEVCLDGAPSFATKCSTLHRIG